MLWNLWVVAFFMHDVERCDKARTRWIGEAASSGLETGSKSTQGSTSNKSRLGEFPTLYYNDSCTWLPYENGLLIVSHEKKSKKKPRDKPMGSKNKPMGEKIDSAKVIVCRD